MILNTQNYPSTTHPRMVALQRRYRNLALQASQEDAGLLPATCTYIPSAGSSIAFDRPVARVGSVLFCRYGQHVDASIRSNDTRRYFQGLRASYQPETGEVLWEREDWLDFPISIETFATSFDERLIRSPRLLDVMIGLQELSSRAAGRDAMWRGAHVPPSTLLGFAPDDRLANRLAMCPTAYVKQHAEDHGLTIAQAWRAIEAETHLSGSYEMTGLQLFDSRLCTDLTVGTKHLPKVLGVFHDLRGQTGRHFKNPTRQLLNFRRRNPAGDVIAEMIAEHGLEPDPGSWTQRQADEAMERMRERMGVFHAFFSDDDICEALVNPDERAQVQDMDRAAVLNTYGETAVVRGIRRLMAAHVSEGATDQDLLEAFKNPERPLAASRIARRMFV